MELRLQFKRGLRQSCRYYHQANAEENTGSVLYREKFGQNLMPEDAEKGAVVFVAEEMAASCRCR